MPKASDFVETEAIADAMPRYDIPAPQTHVCPICSKHVGMRSVPARIPVLMPDGMWHHIFRPTHPYCALMYEQGLR